MKKIAKYISISIPPVRLFLDDIEAIEEIYKANCENYTIETEDFQFLSSEDLKNLEDQKVNNIVITSHQPYITVNLSRHDAHIYSVDDSVIATGIINKIKEILNRRITPLKYLIYFRGFGLSIVINVINILLLWLSQQHESIWITAAMLVNSITFFIVFFFLHNLSYSVVYLIYKKNSYNLFSKYKEQIFLLIIGGLITLAAQLIVQFIIQVWRK